MGAAHGRGGVSRAGFQPPRAGSRQRNPSLSKEGSFPRASPIYVALRNCCSKLPFTFRTSCRGIDSRALLHPDRRRSQQCHQPAIPIQRRALGAAEQIQARRAEFRKRMNRQMGLLQKPDAGNSGCPRELMPDRRAYRPQAHFRNNRLEEVRQLRLAL
jgi:hypothetical protein